MTESLYKYVNNDKKHTHFDTKIFINLGTIIIRKGTYDVVLYVLYIGTLLRVCFKRKRINSYVLTKKIIYPM